MTQTHPGGLGVLRGRKAVRGCGVAEIRPPVRAGLTGFVGGVVLN